MVPALSKWPEKRLGSSLVLKFYCITLNRTLTWYLPRFFFLLHCLCAKENLCYQGTKCYAFTKIVNERSDVEEAWGRLTQLVRSSTANHKVLGSILILVEGWTLGDLHQPQTGALSQFGLVEINILSLDLKEPIHLSMPVNTQVNAGVVNCHLL